jgi:cell division septum initiation protein DivIVA
MSVKADNCICGQKKGTCQCEFGDLVLSESCEEIRTDRDRLQTENDELRQKLTSEESWAKKGDELRTAFAVRIQKAEAKNEQLRKALEEAVLLLSEGIVHSDALIELSGSNWLRMTDEKMSWRAKAYEMIARADEATKGEVKK